MTQIDAGERSAAERALDRGDIFRAAHALVSGLKWGDEGFSVYDVLQVARFLELGESE
ncbi:hypothetical protein ACQEVG_32805 [Streptomyces sp. CA-135486]|uniref:hypothetical protein n=1 Tax=Streptomyces sp. CA-135486 TaxID=3240049 RepID=UPI003D8ABDAA